MAMWTLPCNATIEQFARNNTLLRRVIKRQTKVVLGRDEAGSAILHLHQGGKNAVIGIPLLHDAKLFTKFTHEGRLSLSIPSRRLTLLLSNCDVMELAAFSVGIARALNDTASRPSVTLSRDEWDIAVSRLKRASWNDTRSPQKEQREKAKPRIVKPVRRTLAMSEGTQLSPQQDKIVQMVLEGRSMLFTGGAGTGKSTLLSALLARLPSSTTVAAASTGISAFQLGGMTIHAFAGIGHGDYSIDELVVRIKARPETLDRWKRTEVLVIDEVSMIDANMWDKMEGIAREIRGIDKPFGGIQLVCCGDFFQLPPVDKNGFCFQSRSWPECIPNAYALTTVFRQSDSLFVTVLNEIRVGNVSKEGDSLLKSCVDRVFNDENDDVVATRLYARKANVDVENEIALEALSGPAKTFRARDNTTSSTLKAQLDRICRAKPEIVLKIGAQVMLLKNLDVKKGLQNGARGVVIRYTPIGLPIVRFLSGIEMAIASSAWPLSIEGRQVAVRHQLPLDLAWALSIHKSIGMTYVLCFVNVTCVRLDRAEISLNGIFEPGQAYVALSRCRSPDDLRITDYNIDGTPYYDDLTCVAIRADDRVVKFYDDRVTSVL